MLRLAPLLLLLAPAVSAQTVVERMTCGAISGTVVDDLGDPLPGANVRIEGTHLGAATDFDGEYRIDCVPAGTYHVTASFVGYPQADLSVPVSKRQEISVAFELVEVDVLSGCCFCFVYDPPLISRDPFASRVITGEEIERLPVGR